MLELIARRRDALKRAIAQMNRQNHVIIFCHMESDGSLSHSDWNDKRRIAEMEERLALYSRPMMSVDDEHALISYLGMMSNLERRDVTDAQRKEYRRALAILENRVDAKADPMTERDDDDA